MFQSPLIIEIQRENVAIVGVLRSTVADRRRLPVDDRISRLALRLHARHFVEMIRQNRERIGGIVSREYAA